MIHDLALKFGLRVKRDPCGERIIPGRLGHLYEHGDGRLGIMLLLDTRKKWNTRRRWLEQAGFTIWQNGDTEGSALFDPSSGSQARLAIRLVGAKHKRVPSPAQLEVLRRATEVANLRRNRPTDRAEGPLEGKTGPKERTEAKCLA